MRRKGSYIAPLMLLVLIAGPLNLGISILTPGMADSMLQAAAYDARNAPQAKSTATFLRQHYLDDSFRWSIAQTTYDLAQDGGGASWSPGSLPAENEIAATLQQQVVADYNSRYLDGAFPETVSRCKMSFPDVDLVIADRLTAQAGDDGIRFRASADDLEVVCATAKANTTVFVDLNRDVFSHGNRYFVLYRQMRDNLQRVTAAWDGLQGTEYSGSATVCASEAGALDQAESEALGDARSAVSSAFDDARDLPGGLSFASDTDVSATASVTDSSVQPAGDCACHCVRFDEDGNCVETSCSTEYTADATARPTGAAATVVVQDDEYTIPTTSGENPLEFRVESFQYAFP